MSLSWNERQAQMLDDSKPHQCEWCFQLVEHAITYYNPLTDQEFTVCQACQPRYEAHHE